MKDWTFEGFSKILKTFQQQKYNIITFIDSVGNQDDSERRLILRHDVDHFPMQTLQMAKMEAKIGIAATYFFRVIPSVFKPKIIKEVASLGHEIGYHYEDLSLCGGDYKKSIQHFKHNLEEMLKYYPVKTICMHGSPLSRWDNKTIWKYYDYRNYGIIADTSLDVDYNKVFYISDNGRAWNRTSVSVRDKVSSHFNISIKSSNHLIELIKNDKLPDNVMINAHPDTFFDYGLKWYLNYAFVEAKNIAKWIIVKYGLRK
jgi:hypothetical protein